MSYTNTATARYRRRSASLGALGDLGPTPVAQAALAILAALPPGSGVNPITIEKQQAAGSVNVVDTQYGGTRAEPYYWVNPIPDPSGLINWTGADSGEIRAGLSEAQLLAANVLLAGGDTSNFAEFHPKNADQLTSTANQNITAPAVYTAPASSTFQQVAQPTDQFGVPLPSAADPYGGLTEAEYLAYLQTHGGFAPPPAGTVTAALDAIAAAGGDTTQPTQIIDSSTGRVVGVAQVNSDGTTSVTVPADHNASLSVQSVTGFIDKAAGTLTEIGTALTKTGNAITGAQTGAAAGWNLGNPKTVLLGAAAFAAAVLLFSRGARR